VGGVIISAKLVKVLSNLQNNQGELLTKAKMRDESL
jgi:hypothetical protein